jgi:predicted transport protein
MENTVTTEDEKLDKNQSTEDDYTIEHYAGPMPKEKDERLYIELQIKVGTISRSLMHTRLPTYGKYTSFVNNKLICTVLLQKDRLKIVYNVRKEDLVDLGPVEDVSDKEHSVYGDCCSYVTSSKDVDRVLPFIERVWILS